MVRNALGPSERRVDPSHFTLQDSKGCDLEDPLKLLIAVLDCYFVQHYGEKNDQKSQLMLPLHQRQL